MDIYLCGHGSWEKSGFTNLPKGTTFSVYTPVGRYLGLDQAELIMKGLTGALPADQVFGQYSSVTDLTLHPCKEFETEFKAAAAAGGGTCVMVDTDTKLSSLLRTHAGNNIHWCACRARFGSLDTTEGGLNEDYFPDTGMGVTTMAHNVNKIRSKKVGSGPGAAIQESVLEKNPVFQKMKAVAT
ncbi:MAG: putative adhesin [Marinibacterium sp.]